MGERQESFIVYGTDWEILETLEPKDFKNVVQSMFSLIGVCEAPNLDNTSKIAFIPIRQHIQRDMAKWEEGKETRINRATKAADARWHNSKNKEEKCSEHAKHAISIPSINKHATSIDSNSEEVKKNMIDYENKEEKCLEHAKHAYDAVNVNVNVNGNVNGNVFFKTKEQQKNFSMFFDAYPKHRKIKKEEAIKEWNKLEPSYDLFNKIIKGLTDWKESDDWVKNDGQYVPNIDNFLKQRKWEQAPPSRNRNQYVSTEGYRDFSDRGE